MKTTLAVIAVLAFTNFTETACAATTIASTFGPGDSFGGVPGWAISSSTSGVGTEIEQAMRFVPSGTPGTVHELASIGVGVNMVALAGANELEARIWTDSGNQPGTLLEAISLDGLLDQSGTATIVLGTSTTNPQLTAGTTYWLGLFTDGAGTQVTWNGVENGAGTRAFRINGGGWGTGFLDGTAGSNVGAFRVNAIPEPSTAILLTLGLVLATCRRRP